LHKSVRGSNPDGALYWLTRMLDGGADPRYLARRIIRMAWEDIGLADPRAMQMANDAAATYERLGSPEGELALGQAVIYLAVAAKSNAGYNAYNAARAFVKQDGSRPVPNHLRNAPTKLMKELGHGHAYRYAHDEPEAYAAGETYLPDGMAEPGWYEPTPRGLEGRLARSWRICGTGSQGGQKIMDLVQTIALSTGLAWASGLRLYLVVFLAGVLSYFGYLHLPETLAVLRNPLVIGAAGIMAFAELIADKIPAFDSLWDSVQTFIRIPAGALLAAFAMGDVDPVDGGGRAGRRHDHRRHAFRPGRQPAGDQYLAGAVFELAGVIWRGGHGARRFVDHACLAAGFPGFARRLSAAGRLVADALLGLAQPFAPARLMAFGVRIFPFFS
jgi:hypothetical protein